jgi:hypothetical protein
VIAVFAGVLLMLNQVRDSRSAAQSVAAENTVSSGATGQRAATDPPEAAAPPPAANPPDAGTAQSAQAVFPLRAQYTGHTADAEVSIAVAVHDGQVSAYLCDGKTVEGWYQGSVVNGSIVAKGRGANTLSGSLVGSALAGLTLSGTVSAKGRSWTFSVTPVNSPAGLYRSKTGTLTIGWIKNPDGSVTGLENNNGVEQPAPPLDPATALFVSGGDTVVGQ